MTFHRVSSPPGHHWSDHWAAKKQSTEASLNIRGSFFSWLRKDSVARETFHPPVKIRPAPPRPPDGRRGMSQRAGLAELAGQADTHEHTPTDLHQLHQGHRVEEVEPGESVLSHGGVGYVCDLQRGSVAGKDRVSVERKTVEYQDKSPLWKQTGLPSMQCTKPLPTAQICCPDPWRKSGKRSS